ncbi:MAG: S8 family peptidase [Gemmatimonadaceae bacterium]
MTPDTVSAGGASLRTADKPFTVAGAGGGGIAMFDPTLQWAVAQCGFDEVWDSLDVGHDPGAIGLIDNGRHLAHRALDGRIARYVAPTAGEQSIADHAGSVAGIISARRGIARSGELDVYGCCSAQLVVYNVWTKNEGIDRAAVSAALHDAAANKLPVVNISVTWDQVEEKLVKDALAHCAAENVVVVAAAGNGGLRGPAFYPATDKNVIAVGATNPHDDRWFDSSVGPHIFISAPGQRIWSISGNEGYDFVEGTSFAAPFVTAAVWLAKRRCPDLKIAAVRDLLSKSVVHPSLRDQGLGYGRLDMRKLRDLVPGYC